VRSAEAGQRVGARPEAGSRRAALLRGEKREGVVVGLLIELRLERDQRQL
jgi:hypothetical protein